MALLQIVKGNQIEGWIKVIMCSRILYLFIKVMEAVYSLLRVFKHRLVKKKKNCRENDKIREMGNLTNLYYTSQP